MGITVDIDNGGTFTDGFISRGNEVYTVKVDTTPHDLTVCFADCLVAASKACGYNDLAGFLKETDVIRFSTTVGTNAIIQRRGPRVGLLVSAGHEVDLYGSGQRSVRGVLIDDALIVGLSAGASSEEVKAAVSHLLERGARLIVVSLADSFEDPSEEQRIKAIIKADYPKQYLGSVPVLLASEVVARDGALERTNAAVINAFLHREMVRTLYKAGEDLRDAGYARPLLIAHVNGGAARAAKTKAIDTYNSGPVAGLMGTAYMAKLYGLSNVVSIDIGGTSSDIGVLINGSYNYNYTPTVEGMPLNIPFVDVPTVGGGGGSIARIDESGLLTVGPESAGAMPGPVCYDMGGVEPTVTDADVALNVIDPDAFLGGRRKLLKDKSLSAISEHIAGTLQMTVEDAALAIRRKLIEIGASAIHKVLEIRGVEPSDFALFAFGGAGGSFAAEIAEKLGIDRVYLFSNSPVFSAQGLSTADVVHSYERGVHEPLKDSLAAVKSTQEYFLDMALRDMQGEGFHASDVKLSVELEVVLNDQVEVLILSGQLNEAILVETARRSFGEMIDDAVVKIVRVKATGSVAHAVPVEYPSEGTDPIAALKGMRQVYLQGSWEVTPIYDRALLRSGNELEGPAIIEAIDSTYVIPSGMKLILDKYLNGIVEKLIINVRTDKKFIKEMVEIR